MAGALDPADRRMLVRLVVDAGLSPAEAAARLGTSANVARRLADRWRYAPEGERASARWAGDEPAAVAAAEAAVRAALDRGAAAPAITIARTAAPPRRSGTATRRRLAGLALTLAFVPVGWVASAAVVGEASPVRGALGGGPAEPERISGAPAFDPAAVRAPVPAHASRVAHVRGGAVVLHRRPARASRSRVLRARRIDGRRLPLVLAVRSRRRGWLHVDLPVRPNGSSAWIRTRRATVRVTRYRLRVDLGAHRLTVLRGTRRIGRHRIGVGQAVTPTPTGRYFVTDLIRPPQPGGLYGPYAFGLSAHSPVLTSYGGGPGQIGLHGTNAPEALGSDVSAGCIRVRNRVIRRLARRLPLGTPVVIRR